MQPVICSRILLALLLLCCGGLAAPASPVPFIVHQPLINGFKTPEIVLQYDPVAKTGVDWAVMHGKKWYGSTPAVLTYYAAVYLQDGLKRMTGQDFPVVSKPDLSRGIVLTLLQNAPADIRNDAEVRQALQADPNDQYAANEAFFLRSEKHRVLVVANTADGLVDAVAELLESVGYEILGMGVDWIYTPDHTKKPLVFAVKRAGRPSFYHRLLWATSGQTIGNGTIMTGLTDPADEPVDVSYTRWVIGSRLMGKSMPEFPGHALQAYHRQIIDKMRELGVAEGFLTLTDIGPEANRPPAGEAQKDHWWVNTDARGTPGYHKVYSCDGKSWQVYDDPSYFGSNVDLSVPFVRQIVLEDMKTKAAAVFATNPDDPFIFPMEAEDGAPGNAALDTLLKHKTWYPDYRAKEGAPLGQPYKLHGYQGLNQPKELWDPTSASDNMFGFADWLLREFDKWIDSLPPDQRVTATGKSKKELARCSMYSYNYHDVPPNFNPNLRTRLGIAPFPKHRGTGKWEKLATQEDMARAFQILLPREPSEDYSFYSEGLVNDLGPAGIPPAWDASAGNISRIYQRAYQVGYRGIVRETDLNNGKYALGYYLTCKILWNVRQTSAQLDALRDRWFQRAYGSAWKEMKAYHDFLSPETFKPNAPNNWGKAIRLLDAASRKIDGTREPAAQRRIDDMQLYWYYHYLLDTGLYTEKSPEVKEFMWKGQMSYMVCMYMVARQNFHAAHYAPVKDLAGPEYSAGPAHYTHAETQRWWPKVLDRWKVTPVTNFAETTLANGKPAKGVDLNDLVAVMEMQAPTPDAPFFYNSGYMPCPNFLMVARKKGEELGFTLAWPYLPYDSSYIEKKVPYGVEIWNPTAKKWEPWIDKTMAFRLSEQKANPQGRLIQLVEVRLTAPRPGTYRFDLGYGGNLSTLSSLAYDQVTGKSTAPVGFTYYTNAMGLSQSPVYFYIPKGTKRLDMEVWDISQVKDLQLFTGKPAQKLAPSRKIDIHGMGTKTIPLQPGEDGTVAMISGDNFFLPYLYSVPTLWAKSPAALLIPRGIAEADGLTAK